MNKLKADKSGEALFFVLRSLTSCRPRTLSALAHAMVQ